MPRQAVRTFLDMQSPADLSGAAPPSSAAVVERVEQCPPALWRKLYTEVGQEYHWVDRLAWSDDDIRRYFADAALELWILRESDEPAGYFELKRHDDGAGEIAYFGLMPGGRRARAGEVHADARGFSIWKQETYES